MSSEPESPRLNVFALPTRTTLLFALIIAVIALLVSASLTTRLPICPPFLVIGMIIFPLYAFLVAAPLFMAVARKKKKSSKKPVKRKPRKSVRRTKARPARRRAAAKKLTRKEHPKGKFARKILPKGKFARKILLKGKSKFVPPAPKIVAEEEPLPPPVPPIGRAILLVPKDATYVESLHPTFRWLSVGGSTKYEVQWGEDQTLATKYTSISLATETTIPVEKPLHVGALYYWRVRGGNDAGWGPWSPISSFRVLEETP